MRGDKLNGVHLPGIQLAENVRFVGCTVRGEGACPNGVIATTKIGGKFFLDDRIGIGDDRVDHARRVPAEITESHDGLSEERPGRDVHRSEEHTSELQSLMRISYAVFCLKKTTM